MKILHLFMFLLVLAFTGCNNKKSGETDSMTIFCGSANKPAMEEIAKLFEKEIKIKTNMIFGGSGTLLSQLELSKKGEIYIPGSPDYIIIGNNKNLLIKGSDRIISYLVPAIIVPSGNPGRIKSLDDLKTKGIRIGIGNPKTVCLGLYCIELIENNGILGPVLKNVVTFGASCSKTANLAAMNKVDAILGWRVFHFWNPKRMDIIKIKPKRIPRISYIPISIPVYTKNVELSKKFIEFVLSGKGKEIYKKYGYLTDIQEAKKFAPGAGIGGEYKLTEKYHTLIKNNWKK